MPSIIRINNPNMQPYDAEVDEPVDGVVNDIHAAMSRNEPFLIVSIGGKKRTFDVADVVHVRDPGLPLSARPAAQ